VAVLVEYYLVKLFHWMSWCFFSHSSSRSFMWQSVCH